MVRGNSVRVLVRLGEVRVSWRCYAPGFEQPKHAHRGTYLTLVFRGSIRETVASRCEHAGPLSVVIKPEGTEHADRVGPRGAETLQIWMPRSLTQGSLDRKSRPLSWRWLHGGPLARCMLLLLRDLKDCECLDEGDVQDKVYDLVAQIGEQEERTSSAGTAPRWLQRVRESIDDRVFERLRVRDLAAEARVHPVYLARLFRRHFQCSVCGYVKQARTRAAATLIERFDTALTQIAIQAGFCDQAHMCREFKTGTGLTPGGFRRLTRPG